MTILFSDEDADLRSSGWHIDGRGYAVRTINRSGKLLSHRVVLSRMLGRALNSKELSDHINGQRLDNRRSNLRVVGYSGNAQNRCHHKFRGTCFHKKSGKWQASVGRQYLGVYETREEAACVAAKKRKDLLFITNQT